MKFKRKVKTKDFSYSNLPHNHVDVFKRLITKRFVDITKVGLLTILFLLPFLVFNLASNLVFRSVLITRESDEFLNQLFSVTLIRGAISIPLMMIGFLGIGCLIHFLKKMCWDEMTFISDYFEVLKHNWWRFLLLGLLVGISFGVFIFVYNFIFVAIANQVITYVALIFSFTQFIFILSVSYQYLMLNEVYKLSIRQRIINCLKFSIINIFPNMVFALLTIYPLVLIFINSLSVDIVANILFMFSLSPTMICVILYTNKMFDKYINLEMYPEIYEKGIYRNY